MTTMSADDKDDYSMTRTTRTSDEDERRLGQFRVHGTRKDLD
jgi:hypothetical protein